ncbi:MAG: hypothetical protein RIQ79_1332 [Verrucomicrobiota bacterium]
MCFPALRFLPLALLALLPLVLPAQPVVNLVIDAAAPGKPISPDLVGVFFEDINYSADGGLYAELIQNRSFEYTATEQLTWNAFSFWELVNRGGKGSAAIDIAKPVHPNNPHAVVVMVKEPGEGGFGIANSGFDGIPVKTGAKYDVSFFARQCHMDHPWDANATIEGKPMPVTVRLETKDGASLGEASFEVVGYEWQHLTATITATGSDESARFVLLAKKIGAIALDEISLFPRETFRNRPNGLRPDLAQIIADLHPKFVRFPGGCVAHGNGLGNIYRWKDTLGPVEQRKGQLNLWGYHQSVGLGYHEYFQFCEDIGAKPLPVLAAGVSCQNSAHTPGHGQQCLPLADMPAYIQDVLDLVEYANGPVTSTWGARRAAAGHPAPFGLKYLGIGNEDHITPGFQERFQMIFDAVRKAHPEIVVIGTVGPAPRGPDYDKGWAIANELKIPMVDEHYYEKPEWFWSNLARYDTYDRAKSQVYLGEWASRGNALRNAIAEAAYLTALERNADVVPLASYAPLLAKRGHTQWNPDLIYFTNTAVYPTINYFVQQLFSVNSGDTYLPTTLAPVATPADAAASAVRDSRTGDLILKIVNGANTAKPFHIALDGAKNLPPRATKTVLAGPDADAVNKDGQPSPTQPQTSPFPIAPAFDYEAPANSLTVIRIPSR